MSRMKYAFLYKYIRIIFYYFNKYVMKDSFLPSVIFALSVQSNFGHIQIMISLMLNKKCIHIFNRSSIICGVHDIFKISNKWVLTKSSLKYLTKVQILIITDFRHQSRKKRILQIVIYIHLNERTFLIEYVMWRACKHQERLVTARRPPSRGAPDWPRDDERRKADGVIIHN